MDCTHKMASQISNHRYAQIHWRHCIPCIRTYLLTYLKIRKPDIPIIPAVNANSRQSELINVESWSRVNNLRVNPTKYAEIVFMDKRRKTTVQLPQPMPNVARDSVIKILGITFTNHLSVAEHVQTVINSSVQTLYALRTLHAHGMDDAALQTVFRFVVPYIFQ